MKNFILGFLFLTIGYVSAQSTQDVFDNGNKQYQQEKYNEAIKLYKTVLDQGFHSADLYFNLANAYYKTNQLAEAIYHYEKALVLDPKNNDVKVNLAYAKRGIIDNIKSVPKSAFEKFNDAVLAIFPYNTWAIIAVVCSLIAGVLWMFFFFSTLPSVKKMYFTLGILLSILCVTSLVITSHQYQKFKNTHYGIVFVNEIEVKNAPRDTASETFILHEGTKVKIIDTVGEWKKIKIADGQLGWLPSNSIKVL